MNAKNKKAADRPQRPIGGNVLLRRVKQTKLCWEKGATSATGATETRFVAVVAGKWNYTSDEELVV